VEEEDGKLELRNCSLVQRVAYISTASAACDVCCLPFRDNTKRANLVSLVGVAIYWQIIILLQCLQESTGCSPTTCMIFILPYDLN
jgi:hypothetical protein